MDILEVITPVGAYRSCETIGCSVTSERFFDLARKRWRPAIDAWLGVRLFAESLPGDPRRCYRAWP